MQLGTRAYPTLHPSSSNLPEHGGFGATVECLSLLLLHTIVPIYKLGSCIRGLVNLSSASSGQMTFVAPCFIHLHMRS